MQPMKIESEKIRLVSKQEAIDLIKNHHSFVRQTPCGFNPDTKKYKYIKVELINGQTDGVYGYSGMGATTNIFKYKIGKKTTKISGYCCVHA